MRNRKKARFIFAHPFRHHAYHFVRGAAIAESSTLAILPQYDKGIFWILKRVFRGNIARKISPATDDRIRDIVYSPIYFQVLRLLMPIIGESAYVGSFDRWLSSAITKGEIEGDLFISMQDYLPLSVEAAVGRGMKLFSDQILNQSPTASERILKLGGGTGYGRVYENRDLVNYNIMKKASRITVPSRYCLEAVPPSCHNRVAVVPYGVDLSRFKPDNLAFEKSAERHSKQEIRIVLRANSYRKGFILFSGALRKFIELGKHQNFSRIEFFMLGSVESNCLDEFSSLIEFVRKSPAGYKISITAKNVSADSVPDLLRDNDVFWMPSLSEGMSFALTEAMAVGLPVICTPFCGLDDVVDGVNGFMHDDSIDSAYEGFLRAISRRSQWREIGAAGSDMVRQFTWDRYAVSVGRVLSSLSNDK